MEKQEFTDSKATEHKQIIRKGYPVDYKGRTWIIRNIRENEVDLVDPMDPVEIAEGIPTHELFKTPQEIKKTLYENTPGAILDSVSEPIQQATTEILNPDYQFSKQGETFEEAAAMTTGQIPEHVKQGLENGYQWITYSHPDYVN
jgi:hypothetical protein